MKVFKKFLTVLCSATLIASASVTAFAEAPSTTGGAGNVIAYNFETVTVPTTIKIAFNPQELPITIGGTAEAPVTTTDKIVSLGYGIANKASTDKKVVVKFAANVVAAGDEDPDVEFVDSTEAATAKSDSNASGAEAGEHKIFLYVTPATAEPTINDGSNSGAGAAFAVTTGEDGAKTENASAENLADVKMTAAAEAKGIAFAEGQNYDAFANIGFALDKASYALKSGESIDFDTKQDEVADKLELTAFGTTSITGFTFKGAMNGNTVWTEANIAAISITPIYSIDEKGTEGSVADTHGMVTLAAAADVAEPVAPVTTYTVTYDANYTGADPATKTETVNIGDAPTGENKTFTREGYTQDGWLDAADGDAVDLSTIDAATTVYANWVEDVVELTAAYDSDNTQYRISLAAAVSAVSDITNFKVNGNTVTINSLNSAKDIIKVDRSAVKSAMGAAWDSTTEFTFTFTVDGVNYTCTIGKNG